MFKADYHTHSEYSSDSNAKIEQMILSAIKKGLNEIAVTDHIDLDYPDVSYTFWEHFDTKAYKDEIFLLKEKYKKQITVVYGVEMGLQTRSKAIIDSFMEDKGYEFVIGSTHAVDYKDLYEGSFFEGKTIEKAHERYFEDVLSSVNSFDFFNVYGHLDVIRRYGGDKKTAFSYERHKDIIDEILLALIKKGKGIEVNSSGLRYGLSEPHPEINILKRYKELQGEIITIGSDAHRPSDIAAGFDDIYSMLKTVGFNYITAFRNNQPVFMSIT